MEINEFFNKYPVVGVAFSGGVDSSVLLALAKKYAKRVKAYYVRSQFQPQFESEDALKVAEKLNTELEIINVDVLANEKVVMNPPDRCYYCKQSIFTCIIKKAESDGIDTVLDGTNASDDVSDRPGMKALEELGVLSPLRLCGYTKAAIREIARAEGLPVADKPSYACLATRIPTATPINAEMLKVTEKAEGFLSGLGFKNFRVRWLGSAAKLEIREADLERLMNNRNGIYTELKKYYGNVYLDLKERTDE